MSGKGETWSFSLLPTTRHSFDVPTCDDRRAWRGRGLPRARLDLVQICQGSSASCSRWEVKFGDICGRDRGGGCVVVVR